MVEQLFTILSTSVCTLVIDIDYTEDLPNKMSERYLSHVFERRISV